MNKILGLDLGIASLGYSVVEMDEEHFIKGQILSTGVRIFDVAEHPQSGKSLATPRREARAVRRILRRKAMRMRKIKELFSEFALLTPEELNRLYEAPLPNVWQIRRDALYQKELLRNICLALLHIAKRRGFRSIRRTEERKGEAGKLLQAIQAIGEQLQNSGFKTVGEMFFNLPATEPKRNKERSYVHCVSRKMLEDEVHIILEKQREFGNEKLSKDFESRFCQIAFSQRPLQPSMPGTCTFENGELRAPKNAFTSEMFAVLSKINNIYLLHGGTRTPLAPEQRACLLDLCLSKKNTNFKQVRKLLNITPDIDFNISYTVPKGKDSKEYDVEAKTKVYDMTGYHALKKAIGEKTPEWESLKDNQNSMLDKIAEVLARYKSDKEIKEHLSALGLSEDLVIKLQDVSFSGFMNLSLKAMNKIIPFLRQGMRYDAACQAAGYDFLAVQTNKNLSVLPPLSEDEQNVITSPVARRSIAQARKMINALNKKYGPFDAVHIEVGRDMGRSFQKRKEIEREQKANAEERQVLMEKGIEGIIPKNTADLKKLRLWKEQDGFCMYSGEYIQPNHILEEGFCQVDHILPYSKSLDNTLNNQVLCLTRENQDKKDRLPYEYFHSIGRDWNAFEARVNALKNMRRAKKQRLLKEEWTEKDEEGFKQRNLNDTQLITTFIQKYLLKNLKLTGKYKQGVFCRNGKLTADLRQFWGLNKVREETDKHHALDATVVACCTNAMMNHISFMYTQNREKEIHHKSYAFPWPWPRFKKSVEDALQNIFISRPPRKKITGPLHEATMFSARHLAKGFKTLRVSIQELTVKDLQKQRELEKKYFGVERNKNLYDAIEKALQERKDPKDPVSVVLTAKNGKKIPVFKIKMIKEGTTGVMVLKGHAIAKNGSMPRVDVFFQNGKYHLVPVYAMDFAKGKLPLVSQPDQEEMKLENFLFSLYKDDYIHLVNKKGEYWEGYFTQYGITTKGQGQVCIESHDRSAIYTVSGKPANKKKIDINTLKLFEKYQIDVWGGQHQIKREKYVGNIRKNKCMGG